MAGDRYVAGDRSFSVNYPAGWHASAVGTTGAVLQRSDHRGVVLVRERPALKGTLASLVKDLPRQLAKRFSDFRPVGASVAHLSTRPAVVYTFVRTKANKVQTIVIAPTAGAATRSRLWRPRARTTPPARRDRSCARSGRAKEPRAAAEYAG